MMTIVYDVSHIQTRRAGIGRYSLSLLSEILRVDKENSYVLHGWSFSIDRAILRGLVSPRAKLKASKIPGFVKRIYWETLPVLPLSAFTGRFDIFHSSDPFSPPVGKRKLVVTVYDLLSVTHPQYFERTLVRRCRRLAEWVGRSDAIIVPSQFTLQQLVGSGIAVEKKIHLVPPFLAGEFSEVHGSSDEATVAGLGLHRPYILFVGTIEPRKNISGLVKAYELLCLRGADEIDLVIAGKMGWMSSEVLRLIRVSPCARWIHRLEYLPEAVLGPLYRRALCFVYPSFVEGYGLPIAEAMACGIPVITSNNSGMEEIGAGAALLVDPHSPEEIAQAILGVVNNSWESKRLRESGLRRAAGLRQSANARTVIRLYESVMSQ